MCLSLKANLKQSGAASAFTFYILQMSVTASSCAATRHVKLNNVNQENETVEIEH